MSFYLDTNVLLSLFVADANSAAVDRWFDKRPDDLLVSDFARLEFAAVISRMTRTGEMSASDATEALADCDDWILLAARLSFVQSREIAAADRLVRNFATKLAGPDAVHLASAVNLGATLVTFDQRLADAARGLGAEVSTPQ